MKFGPLALSILSAALLLLGLYPLGWFWCSWLAWVPLFFLSESLAEKPRSFLGLVFLTSLIYCGIENYWLLYYQLPLFLAAAVLSAGGITLYFALYHLLTRRFRWDSLKIISAIVLWIACQYAIRLTPLSTAAFEAPFYGPLAFFQIAFLADYSVLGALILGFSLALVLFYRKRSWQLALWIVLLSACFSGLYAWGHHRLQTHEEGSLKVALIQHNIPVSGKWRLEHPDEIRSRYTKLALIAAATKPDLIIFPLYNFPDDPLRQPNFFLNLAKKSASHVLVASHIPEVPGGDIFEHGFRNVAVLFSPDGKIEGHYQAVEKAPSFSSIKEHSAQEYKVLDSSLGKLGILLCYEDAKPKFAREAKKQGARLLIALSNPGFFSKTHMPYYHLIQDRLRAIETDLPLLRVSANGYSAHIDSRGRFIQKSQLDKEEILMVKV